jgi:hypothetical protein
MYFSLLRFAIALAFISCVVSSSCAEPVRRALTAAETAALQEPIELGKRVYNALYRYLDPPQPRVPNTGPDVLTGWPTVDLLHAVGYIADSDMRLVRQYRVTIPRSSSTNQRNQF